MRRAGRLAALVVLVLAAVSCTGAEAVLVGNSINAAAAAVDPPIMHAFDGVKGWTRTGPPDRYSKDGLYGYIDGGAEIVLEYGFRELSVYRFRPAAGGSPLKELIVEIYRMRSGPAAFGFYSTKLEGDEEGWPGIRADNWVGLEQANLVSGDYYVNLVAIDCPASEVGAVLMAIEKSLPARRTVRPGGLRRLPHEGQVPTSWRYVAGPVAARNESPFLDGDFWGFEGAAGGGKGSQAFAAKYGPAPAVSKLVVVELGRAVDAGAVDAGVSALFADYLQGVGRDGAVLEGRNEAGRWFLYGRTDAVAALVLGEPDRAAGVARLETALGPAGASPDAKR